MGESNERPALQVIILGSGGGPLEDNTTAFLVRSIAAGWRRGSVLAVDAGVHLAAISKILEPYIASALLQTSPRPTSKSSSSSSSTSMVTLTSGPFQGLELPFETTGANAAHITRNLIDTYLITHPHLDHISAFVVNTASLHASRPKRLAGLPSTISAFKQHIFNNVIWPNLSDENNGAGLVTYMRLAEGGSLALGAGDNTGYVEITEGLSVKTWSVSHGHCMENHPHRGSSTEFSTHGRGSHDRHSHVSMSDYGGGSPARYPPPASEIFTRRFPPERTDEGDKMCVYDSSAYFIRDIGTNKEVLIFGDVEPDSLSLSPRNLQIWTEAAPKIAAGLLKAILIECSYTDSRADSILFGHLSPRHLIAELQVLASLAEVAKKQLQEDNDAESNKKRKRSSNGLDMGSESQRRRSNRSAARRSTSGQITAPTRPGIVRAPSSSISPRSRPQNMSTMSGMSIDQFDEVPGDHVDLGTPLLSKAYLSDRATSEGPPVPTIPELDGANSSDTPTGSADIPRNPELKGNVPILTGIVPSSKPLHGLKVVIIHVKEKLEDEEPLGDTILRELRLHEVEADLGCDFVISEKGMSIYL